MVIGTGPDLGHLTTSRNISSQSLTLSRSIGISTWLREVGTARPHLHHIVVPMCLREGLGAHRQAERSPHRKQVGFRRPVAQTVVGDDGGGESCRAREASTGDRSRDRESSDDGLDPDLAGRQGAGDEDSGVAHLARSWSRALGSSSLAMSSSPEDEITKEQIQAQLAKYPKRHQVQRSRLTEHGVLPIYSSEVS